MPDFSAAFAGDIPAPVAVLGRLIAAMVLGAIVAQVWELLEGEAHKAMAVPGRAD